MTTPATPARPTLSDFLLILATVVSLLTLLRFL